MKGGPKRFCPTRSRQQVNQAIEAPLLHAVRTCTTADDPTHNLPASGKDVGASHRPPPEGLKEALGSS